jgi:hypothetical protein
MSQENVEWLERFLEAVGLGESPIFVRAGVMPATRQAPTPEALPFLERGPGR